MRKRELTLDTRAVVGPDEDPVACRHSGFSLRHQLPALANKGMAANSKAPNQFKRPLANNSKNTTTTTAMSRLRKNFCATCGEDLERIRIDQYSTKTAPIRSNMRM